MQPSNYTFNGIDLQDPNSKAGTGIGGLNLNSVTVHLMLQNNQELCKQVYDGIVPSYYGASPTVSDGGTATVEELPTEVEFDEKGNIEEMNPMDLVKQSASLPTYQFTGTLSPLMYRDAAQPTTFMPPGQVPMAGMMQAPMGYSSFGMFNYNPMMPGVPIYEQRDKDGHITNQSLIDWNNYQRKEGFRAPVPMDTDFKAPGMLCGFHQGFDPYEALETKDDHFYDVSMGGKLGVSEWVHRQNMLAAGAQFGWNPNGQMVDRREMLMFPGINENHLDPLPSDKKILGWNGMPQQRHVTSTMPSMPANALPINNMVSTNPFMAGINRVGGFAFNQTQYPTPMMQARYNYAIECGFQSIQEMDKNDFRVIRMIAKAAHSDMTDEEFNKYFDENWCKAFLDIKSIKKRMDDMPKQEITIPKMKTRLVKGDKVLAGHDYTKDSNAYYKLVNEVRSLTPPKREQQLRDDAMFANIEMMKDDIRYKLYDQAPERKYDDKSFVEYMGHGFSESHMAWLDYQDRLIKTSAAYRQKVNMVDSVAFMRNCLTRGMGILPAATSRLKAENDMFYVNQKPDEEEAVDKPRGTYGKDATGKDLDLNMHQPMYGYLSYIPDVNNPNQVVSFPKKRIEEVYKQYLDYCGAINEKSRSAMAVPISSEDFINSLGVTVIDDEKTGDDSYGSFDSWRAKLDEINSRSNPNIISSSIEEIQDEIAQREIALAMLEDDQLQEEISKESNSSSS